ncbi:MAG: SRPBCC family protein [Patescibacteria group bacterium]|nr:SRPBCC family protein [Patescibacteria group bacterium]
MPEALTANAEVLIEVPVNKVWEAFVDPKLIKKYMFGTTVKTDWKKGSKIFWRGEWNGKPYEDNGEILENKKLELLKYTYYSSISDKGDEPENYNTITVQLTNYGDKTKVVLTQDNIDTLEAKDHSEENWKIVFDKLKMMLETD